jgi:plasmid stabilization system protein ParE
VKPVRFHDQAKTELASEALYYSAISTALAERFVKAVEDAVDLASEFPGMGSPYKYGTRRIFPKKFPFSVVYLERPDEVHVLAIAPFAKKPGYWRTRKSSDIKAPRK